MRKGLIPILILFAAETLLAQEQANPTSLSAACAKKCDNYKPVEICFVSQDARDTLPLLHSSCLGIADIRTIKNPTEIIAAFKSIAQDCGRISKMVMFGHASNTSIALNDSVDSEAWQKLDQDLSCVMENDALIDLRGCRIGAGCDGQKQIFNIAKAFFNKKSGTVTAATALAVNDRLGLSRPVSVNGKNRTIRYSGDSEPVFGYDGLLLSTPAANAVCRDEVKSLENRIQQLERLFKNKKCTPKAIRKYQVGLHDLGTHFRNSGAKMPPAKTYLASYEYWIEKSSASELSQCLKDNYREKLRTSSRADDQAYLRKLEEQDEAELATSDPTSPAQSKSIKTAK